MILVPKVAMRNKVIRDKSRLIVCLINQDFSNKNVIRK